MPSREEEYYAGRHSAKGQPLCPFCGSKDVYPVKQKRLLFIKHTIGWSCANERCRMYRKIFPNPSWGSGRGDR